MKSFFTFLICVSAVHSAAHDNHSGDRLKKIIASFEDNAEMLITFYDTKLRTDCVLQEDTSKKFRCYPVSSFSDAATKGVFIDSSCKIKAGIPTRTLPRYLGPSTSYSVSYDKLGKVQSVRSLTWSKSSSSARYTIKNGSCKYSSFFSKNAKYKIKMGSKLDPTDFVEAKSFRKE